MYLPYLGEYWLNLNYILPNIRNISTKYCSNIEIYSLLILHLYYEEVSCDFFDSNAVLALHYKHLQCKTNISPLLKSHWISLRRIKYWHNIAFQYNLYNEYWLATRYITFNYYKEFIINFIDESGWKLWTITIKNVSIENKKNKLWLKQEKCLP